MSRRTDWEDDFEPEEEEYSDRSDQDGDEPTIPCPYCGKHVYEESDRCPHCQHYIRKKTRHPPESPGVLFSASWPDSNIVSSLDRRRVRKGMT